MPHYLLRCLVFLALSLELAGGKTLLSSSEDSKVEYCRIGDSCIKYCEGWHDSKQLYYITSCPKEDKSSRRCKAMECKHTSESEADTKGCFCCCGDDPVPEAEYHGPDGAASEGQYIQLPRAGYAEFGDEEQYIQLSNSPQYTPYKNGCTVGGGCRSYCEGWHKSKQLFFITSCRVPDDKDDDDYKKSCMDMNCQHTSKSSADTDGCYCCCGDEPVAGATFHGPNSALKEITGDEVYKVPRSSDPGITIGTSAPQQLPCSEDVMGKTAGMAACDHVVTACLHGPENAFAGPPVDQSIALLHQEMCNENEKAICIVAGRRFQRQIDPRCGDAVSSGLGRCSPAAAQGMYGQLLEFYCGV
eukprot:CAMPEP_0117672150 /NCGR_PEP_ID=MMETSP0804-20121206/13741_1 /TAXON_ID=1074897 /ORGANISM="Tetraselmis astigmatica, Strain CCMP880" /LENGTH=357 /DNA_ID=CAMNT_0005480713 /DNA_START=113 /DNA_END=1186 /DNA_ORIENTATION=-